jgi:hypothetical protein
MVEDFLLDEWRKWPSEDEWRAETQVVPRSFILKEAQRALEIGLPCTIGPREIHISTDTAYSDRRP